MLEGDVGAKWEIWSQEFGLFEVIVIRPGPLVTRLMILRVKHHLSIPFPVKKALHR